MIKKILILMSLIVLVSCGSSTDEEAKNDATVFNLLATDFYAKFETLKTNPETVLKSVSNKVDLDLYLYSDKTYSVNGDIKESGTWSIDGSDLVLEKIGFLKGVLKKANAEFCVIYYPKSIEISENIAMLCPEKIK